MADKPGPSLAVDDAEAEAAHKPSSPSSPSQAAGVSRVEAFNRVLYQSGRAGQILLWLLGLSIGLTMFAYALDLGITTTVFTTMASSTFRQHSQLGAVAVASQVIRAVSKPFIGKLADITSRPTTYLVVLAFYALGFLVAATSSTFAAYTVGICFTAVGKSGLDLLSDVIVGDLTPLEWRGFFGAVLSLPFVVTVPINGFIGAAMVDRWRWGLGMFAIVIPVLLAPAIVTLYVMQRRGEKLGMVTMAASKRVRTGTATEAELPGTSGRVAHWLHLLRGGLIDIDIIGLIILGVAFSLILLPFSIAKSTVGGWGSPRIIAMLVVGFLLLVVFGLYERFLSPKPVMSPRIMDNRTFVASAVIFTFNQMASSVRNTYLASYVYIIKQWTEYQWIIFLGITTMGLCLLGPIVGLVQRRTHRYKSLMVFGAAAKIAGYGLLIDGGSGSMTQDTARLVAAQLVYCLSSFNVVGARVGSQASVPHEDMASMISLLTLWSTLGSSVGSAIASAIWTNEMPGRLRRELPNVDGKTIAKIYGSIKKLRHDYAFDDPIRQGSIRAYAYVNGHIAVTALVLAAPPFIACFFMPDFYLGKQQNAVTNTGLNGEKVEVPVQEGEHVVNDDARMPFHRRWLAAYRKA
ncbi:Major facilitator superfamily domain, general substrate transporter [Cordyceps fumosorosea ARSEF 2679]|uniref:Major facilitator superfamily domain, general substrate transporter n=1 Tax=Cordyceps fumosorosea (strain ARSEF 2679) TaxID=1081104 RepID=A0A168B6J2_CORFA|nr:Major facilitator superfamily domain, general substrate transporter [Cordyceps fumosorosea ARSEF 2679]OAA69690.1 Major facilitator superfamily domain, general substrate transporter [Cordyceps fumosorosea ARSEF 2679]